MNSELISIIVPVYNVEKYIEKCIESIMNQTYKNIEIILIDDGSTDNSGKICDDFAVKDNRIKVLHKKNGGLSSARNVGLDIAVGNYIGFIDSDDSVHHKMYELLYKAMVDSNADIAECDHLSTNNKDTIIEIEKTFSINEYTGKERLLECRFKELSFCVWPKLYKKESIIRKFNEKIILEDLEWTPEIIFNCNKIVYIDMKMYIYLRRSNSITTTPLHMHKIKSYDFAVKYNIDYFKNRNKEVHEYFIVYYANWMIGSALNISNLHDKEEKKLFKNILKQKLKSNILILLKNKKISILKKVYLWLLSLSFERVVIIHKIYLMFRLNTKKKKR